MKTKNKANKVHPAPAAGDTLSVLNLLPAAILSLISVLSIQDRDVLAYMLTHSMKESNRKRMTSSGHHKPPVFDCDCFDCYTWYWFKWDSSVNRELIHQAIEAFEEHALEVSSKKGKKKEKMGGGGGGRRSSKKCDDNLLKRLNSSQPLKAEKETVEVNVVSDELLNKEVDAPSSTAENMVVAEVAEIQHKGLARKMLPDVLGLFNLRLWSLWIPNV